LFRNSYDLAEFVPAPSDAAPQPGITDPFQALFAAIDSDLQAVLQNFSDKQKKQLQTAATEHYFNSRQTALPRFSITVTAKEGEGLSALVYEELILQTINSYFNLYYEDLLAPYSAWLNSAGNSDTDTSALLETESQILARQVIGIGSVVEAVALQLSDQTAKDALAFTSLLKSPPFASYSQFQPLEERRRAQASFVGVGLITGMPEQPLVVTVDGEQMALNGSVEEQYGWWRRMIVDLIAASEEITQNAIVPGQ